MSTIKYEIEFFSNWHCGSGLAAGADVDALVIKDKNGLPYIPGRTLKGLLRDAATILSTDQNVINNLFGVSGDMDNHKTGCAFFENATLPSEEYNFILKEELTKYLYQTFASTSIDEDGIAEDKTLRKIETVVPCKLEGNIYNVPEVDVQMLKDAMNYIKRLGTGRNRGYGRCKITIKKPNDVREEMAAIGKSLKFKCTLESDLVLSQTSSSEGNQKTLDFIPGNNFLGIAASKLYKDGSKESLEIFHSGKVRFGDAHPSINGIRGLKVPASMYYPKLGSASEECYIHHLTNHESDTIKNKQLKQCREGFYSFGEKTGKPAVVLKNYAIKSAYDSQNRRSKDGQLFGYESLSKGSVLYFEVESELSDELNQEIIKSLCGMKHIGHSRSAEFGLVKIEQADYKEIETSQPDVQAKFVTVYADGRLIFFDKNMEQTCLPEAEDLGLEGGEIDWSKCQVRTFQYAPWNGKRHTYEADRFGIEKGSVFVVELKDASCPEKSQYVGYYRNEGFGKVIYNPAFLAGDLDGTGKALYTLEEKPKPEGPIISKELKVDSLLIGYLLSEKQRIENNQNVYQTVQKEVTEFERSFKEGKFSSQWGYIRSIAAKTKDINLLYNAIEYFISHGVAKDKWEEQDRKGKLLKFMDAHKNEDLQSIMINLASEMTKKCQQKEEVKL